MRIVLALSGRLWSGLVCVSSPAAPLTRAEQEQFLATAKITKMRAAKDGITGTQWATLTEGTLTHDAHIQTIDESKFRF